MVFDVASAELPAGVPFDALLALWRAAATDGTLPAHDDLNVERLEPWLGRPMFLKHLVDAQVRRIIACARAPAALMTAKAFYASPERSALVAALAMLSPAARHELVALMWLGGGDNGGDVDAIVAYARDNADAGEVGYIASKSRALPLYLEAGLVSLLLYKAPVSGARPKTRWWPSSGHAWPRRGCRTEGPSP